MAARQRDGAHPLSPQDTAAADDHRGTLGLPRGGAQATIDSGPLAPSSARALMREWLGGRVSGKVLDDALLLVSELVTNSVRHAGEAVGAPLHVSADLTAGVLRLRVTDGGRNGAVAPRAPSHDGGGYGLHLIDQLAARWGVDRGGGTQVWCELVCERDSPLPRRSRAAGAALPAH